VKKIYFLSQLLFLFSFFNLVEGQANVEEAKSQQISFDNKFGKNVLFLNKYNPSSDTKIKPWYFSDVIKNLPSNIKNSKEISVGCDDEGMIWVIHSGNGTVAYNRGSNSIFYQSVNNQDISVTPNGKYIIMTPENDEDALQEIYRAPGMKKVFSKPVRLESILGGGRYAVIEGADGDREVFDFENPSTPILSVGAKEFWHQGVICESEDGSELLKKDSDGMTLYGLPSFTIVKKYKNLGTGRPFINGTGTILGWNRGVVCYFLNPVTGDFIGYGPDEKDDSKLIMGKVVEGYQGSIIKTKDGRVIRKPYPKSLMQQGRTQGFYLDVVTGVIDIATLKTIQTFDAAEESVDLFVGGNDGISRVICPSGSSDVWLVINRAKKWENLKAEDGDCLLVLVGENLKIKKVVHYSKILSNSRWDNEKKSIINTNPDGNSIQVMTGQ
jgi:hypothetical protein